MANYLLLLGEPCDRVEAAHVGGVSQNAPHFSSSHGPTFVKIRDGPSEHTRGRLQKDILAISISGCVDAILKCGTSAHSSAAKVFISATAAIDTATSSMLASTLAIPVCISAGPIGGVHLVAPANTLPASAGSTIYAEARCTGLGVAALPVSPDTGDPRARRATDAIPRPFWFNN
ncbi:uncharacterized protein CLUP02_01616 [Colletotrichum lupini]|uniref:Uncharacterized protein n=1 Tax=Colletotrichum lupini TaxID=145971 RepID=A0A9Q8W8U9_9PEZI|nr:uncharacterized protein CLUP02_01616 [Colletotrichum lupini]UQC74963.1 hypothetical protein CLUP02_01616 [Colletotrichum lupini]